MQIFLTICSILGGLFGLYFFLTCLGGITRKSFWRKAAAPSEHPHRRIAAIIAARNEEAVVGNLVRSLMAQDYPRELFDVFVVPNNCTDATEAIACEAGARILHCTGPIRSKGDALRCAFAQLTAMEEKYDAYCIFDADNLVNPLFFRAVNDARDAGYHAGQGYRDSKNPYDSWISGSMSVFYWFMSCFYNGSRAALGLSCAFNGTGFMVSDELIRDLGWNTFTLTEDLEFSAQCALAGYRIGWMPNARVYDEQPIRFWDSVIQRHRWSFGSLQCMRRYACRLFKKGSLHCLDMGIVFTGMLLNLVGVASAAGSFYLLMRQIINHPQYLPQLLIAACAALVMYYLATTLFALIMFWLQHRLTMRALPAILLFGLFLTTWAVINLACFFTRTPKWKVMHHTSNAAMPE